jgi:hypothetical protein
VPTHYTRDLFKKLQILMQGTKTVKEYFQEMEIAMIRANVKEDDEKTMARFLNGLNHPIKKIADFQPYTTLLELVHQATKAERQVQEDLKYARYSTKTYGFSKQVTTTSTPPSTIPRFELPQAKKTSLATSNRKHHQVDRSQPTTRPNHLRLHLHRMTPRQAPSSVSHAPAEATSHSSAQQSAL